MSSVEAPPRSPEPWGRWTFLAVLAFGLLFAAVTPPFQVPDEPEHFYRAWGVSTGRWIPVGGRGSSGGMVPASLPRLVGRLAVRVPRHPEQKFRREEIIEAFAQRLNAPQQTFVPHLTSAYSFVPYLPAAAGIALARLFSDSALVLLYAGRIGGVLACAGLLAAAARVTPIGGPLFFLLPLTPMAIFLTAGVTADAFTNAFAFLFIAFLLRLALGVAERVRARDLALLFLASAILGLTKPGYLFLPALFLAVPAARVGSAWRRSGWTALALAAAVTASACWAWTIRRIYPPLASTGVLQPESQLRAALAHPLDFAGFLLREYGRHALQQGSQYLGNLGWLDTRLPTPLLLSILLVLLLTAATCGRQRVELRRWPRGVILTVTLASLCWIATLLWVVFTPPGSPFISSMQGRYDIPLGPLLFLLLYNRRWCIDWCRSRAVLGSWAAASLGATLLVVIRRYYG